MIRWDVITGNLPLISQKFVEHVLLTVTAVGIGLVLSFLAVLAIRRWRVLTGPITGIAGAIYTIPSLALLVFLIPITRLTATTAEIALVGYTLLILIRNLLAGLDLCRGTPSTPRTRWATARPAACGRWSCRSRCP